MARGAKVLFACLVMALILVACANAKTTASAGGSGKPGVTSNSITVGSIANVTGVLSSDFAPILDGVKAYFDMINAEGGVDGRKLLLPAGDQKDDQGIPSTDLAVAEQLVEQDHVFAIVGVGTPFFGGASYLAHEGVPTFGYLVSADWSDGPTLFGAYGSYLGYSTGVMSEAWAIHQLGASSVGVIAYGVQQSAAACQAAVSAFPSYGITVGFEDLDFGLGADPTPDVLQMESHHVGLLLSCLDISGNVAFAQTLNQYALKIPEIWLDGYDRSALRQYGSLLNGVTISLQHIPFEAPAYFPGTYPGMETYLQVMQHYEPQYTYDEVALEGWINAAQFVAGLRAVGRDLTQAKVVAAINRTTNFTAGGIITPDDWLAAHTSAGPGPFCASFVKAENSRFVPEFVQSGNQVFVCFAQGSDTPVTPQPGTPGT